VELADVEGALLASAELREAAVVALDDEKGRRRLVAHVVPEPGSQPTASALRRAISERLDRHRIPARFVFLDRLPLSPNGKVDRSALAPPGPDRPPLDTAFVGAGTPLTHSLTEIWEDLLRVRPIGIRDDFFDLGGDSLLAAEMICHIETRFGRSVDASAMLRGATIENLAASMTSGDHELRKPVVTLNPNGTRAPLFFLHGDYVSEGFYGLDLARCLGADQPLSLLAPCGVDGRSIPRSYGAMAERHLEALRAVRPVGPYRIGGRCNGALVAYEMARKLVAEGQTVELLLLCYASADGLRFRPLRTTIERFGALARWGPEKRLEYLLRARQFLRSLGGLPPWRRPVRVLGKGVKLIGEILADQIARLGTRASDLAVDLDPGPRTARGPRERIIEIYHQLDDEWTPEPYPGPITLIWPEEDPQPAEAEARLWRRLVPEVELRTVPGDYDAIASRSVRQLADVIADSLARADAPAQARR
jgi:acyl carrier protein